MNQRSGKGALIVVLGLIGVGAIVWANRDRFTSEEETRVQRGVEVQRGPLRISVTQRGNLEAKNSVSMKSEIEGQTTVLYLIPEGTMVEEGDLLAELDVANLVDRRITQEISVESALAASTKAIQQLEIQKSQNESDHARAQQTVEFAGADLVKYREGDWPQELQKAEEDIVLAEEERLRAEERLNWSGELADKGFLTRTELEGDELKFKRAEIMYEQAQRQRELLIDFDNPRNVAELEADLKEAERELDRVRLQSAARLTDFEVAVASTASRLAIQQNKLEKLVNQISKARLIAPAPGMVVYAQEPGGHRGGGEPMQEGRQVRERQEIVTIPRSTGMTAKASVHESVLKQVRTGQTCLIRVDALPGQEFSGRVEFVAVLPDKNSWWANPNQRLYRTEVVIDEGAQEMRPGMSCSIEILVSALDDALFVPQQSVHYDAGKTVCFLDPGAERREVEIGLSNEKFVQILGGLNEQDRVLLSPPAGWVPEARPEARSGEHGGGGARPEKSSTDESHEGGKRTHGKSDKHTKKVDEGAGARTGAELGQGTARTESSSVSESGADRSGHEPVSSGQRNR